MGDDRLQGMTDEQLVLKSQSGDVQAFNELAHRWETSLYQFVRRTVGNPEEARDLCQEALTKAYQNIERLREGEKFKSWIHHIALNLCRDRFRSAKSKADIRSIDDVSPGDLRIASNAPDAGSPEIEITKTTMAEILGDALQSLPTDQKNAIVLKEYHGFSSQEISEITGVPAATVRTRIFYGLKSLRKSLEARGVTGTEFLEGR